MSSTPRRERIVETTLDELFAPDYARCGHCERRANSSLTTIEDHGRS